MFELTMLTMDGKKHTEEIERISLPTDDGIRTILANHMPAVLPVEIGKLLLINGNEREEVVVSEGIFNFKENDAHLFVRTFEFAHEIDEARAERAKKRAEERLATELTEREFQEEELALKRAITRISAVR
jgi:F-type H+-transporting ATPase subunit epsilon